MLRDLPRDLAIQLRRELRELAEKACEARERPEAEHWAAVSIFVTSYVGAQRAFAQGGLPFKSPEHVFWCDTVLRAVEQNLDEDPEQRVRLYAELIAGNDRSSEWVEWMSDRAKHDWLAADVSCRAQD